MNTQNQTSYLLQHTSFNEGDVVYMIGIGGIGMSALAKYFAAKKCVVIGYDKTKTALTQTLEDIGIAIHYNDTLEAIVKEAKVVVYTPAIPKDHIGLQYYLQHQYLVVKRSDVLQWISENTFNICIAGTHGKTTVTSMVAHILRDSQFGCTAFLGGIAANYQTNFWSSNNDVVVVEADEYDRSFLKLSPDIAIITSMDADHLDIYGTAVEVENAFIQFSQRVKKDGCLITKFGLTRANELQANHKYTYCNHQLSADVTIDNLQVNNGSYLFNIIHHNWRLNDVTLHMGGLHNIENALAAITVAKHLGIDDAKIKSAIASFKGVKRRFEYILKTEKSVLIDDYAHHPEELKALINGVKSIFPQQPITLVFQPHLYSRTQDLADAFATSLSMADQVILLPIYPARELPIEGVTSELLLNKIHHSNKQVLQKQALLSWMSDNKPSLVVMAGAGDIDTLLQPVKEILSA
ncbi:MAG: UDP-N-acetylmuramate--L-alanine ligase [Chitinophagaceae bacterium]